VIISFKNYNLKLRIIQESRPLCNQGRENFRARYIINVMAGWNCTPTVSLNIRDKKPVQQIREKKAVLIYQRGVENAEN